jgi:hypothetical protein
MRLMEGKRESWVSVWSRVAPATEREERELWLGKEGK